MTLLDVLNHHLSGGSFEYKTYDHKKAKEEFLKTEVGMDYLIPEMWNSNEPRRVDKWDIPSEIREKYSFWRKGKIRKIEFSPTGTIYRIYIGSKYAIPFYDSHLNGLRLT